jgi:hypothetical protein
MLTPRAVQGSPVTGEQHLRTATARQHYLVLLNLELLKLIKSSLVGWALPTIYVLDDFDVVNDCTVSWAST